VRPVASLRVLTTVRPRTVAVTVVALVAVLAAACSPSPGATDPSAPPPSPGGAAAGAAPTVQPMATETTLRVLASNELTDMDEVASAALAATNVKLDITYTDTAAGAKTIASGDQQYDAVWFDSNAYLSLQPKASRWVATSTKIMSSPVALGLDAAVAQELGWDKKAPTWEAIARAAGQRKFRYGMSDPATSNPAFATLANVATALAGTGTVLKASEIDAVAPDLRRFFSAQSLTARSANFLADRFVDRVGQPDGPQGLVNYESTLLALNGSGRLEKPLTVVIPADGVISADFPLTLLNAVSPEARDAYQTVTDWLRSPPAQQQIMDTTARRPISAAVKPDPKKFGDRLLVELPFPSKRAVLDRLLTSYVNSTRQVTQSIYVLDVSGSMEEEDRIEQLRAAMISLAGGEGSVKAGGYTVFRAREKVTLIPYDDEVREPQTFTLSAENPNTGRARIRTAAGKLETDAGNTATYSALREAYRLADRQVRENPDAITSIVLMTDGEQNRGIEAGAFREFYRDLRSQTRAVPTFPVQFGDAPRGELNGIAKLTGGKLFAAKDTSLVNAFRTIRGYQ
jgi:Ca-activated chloride channel family protein